MVFWKGKYQTKQNLLWNVYGLITDSNFSKSLSKNDRNMKFVGDKNLLIAGGYLQYQ